MTDNVIPYRENRATTVRRYLDAWREANELWIERAFNLAFELKAAREECGGNDRAFGQWLLDNDCDDVITKDERAALIKIAEYSDIARQEMERTGNRSIERLWRDHIKPRVDAMTYRTPPTDQQVGEPAEIPAEVIPIAPPRQTAPPFPGRTSVPRSGRRSPFYGRERAAEVQAVYLSANTRTDIGKVLSGRGGNDLWPMILTAIDAGFLTATNYNTPGKTFSLRILFPHGEAASFCRGIDLSTPQAIKRVRDFVLPAMIANKDAILANPSQTGPILNRAEYDAQRKANAAAATARMAERRAAMPKHEYEVIMYGETFWPNPNPQIHDYTYDQTRAACWYFHETNQLFMTAAGGREAKGRVMMLRFSTRWFSQYADREMTGEQRDKIKTVFRLVHAMAGAMEQNPDAASNLPPRPTTDGEWP